MPARLTEEQVHAKIKEKHGDKLVMVGGYEASSKKANFKCNVCNHKWTTEPNGVITKGYGCKPCADKQRGLNKTTPEVEVHRKIMDKFGSDVVMIGEYTTANKPTKFKCNVCNHEWNIKPDHVMNRGSGCRKCYGNSLIIPEKIAHERIRLKHNDTIKMVGQYVNASHSTKFKCNVCDHVWKQKPSKVMNGTGCLPCDKTAKNKNQNSLKQYFTDYLLGIELLSNHYPDFLKTKTNKKGLELDLYWPELQIALELDGAQHYKPIEHWGGQENFKKTQANDKLKNKLCKKEGIHLIRVDGRKFKYNLKEEKRAEMFNEMLTEIVHVAHSRGLIGTTL